MADERVDQGDIVQSFQEKYTLVDSTEEDNFYGEDTEGQRQEPVKEGKKEEPKKEPAKKEPEGGEAKEKTDEKKSAIKELKEPPAGFQGLFFKKDEKGSVLFDRDKYNGFVLPTKDRPRFEIPVDRIKYAEPPKESVKPLTREEKMRSFIKEEMDFRKKEKENRFAVMNRYLSYLKGGAKPEEAYGAAVREIEQSLSEEWQGRDIENQIKWPEKLGEETRESAYISELRNKARDNEALTINQIAKAFNVDYKAAQEHYVDIMKNHEGLIRTLFFFKHPEYKEGKTQTDASKAFEKFWYQTASDPDLYNFVIGLVFDRFHTSMSPYLADQIYSEKKSLESHNRRANIRPASNINRPQRSHADDVKDLENHFGVKLPGGHSEV